MTALIFAIVGIVLGFLAKPFAFSARFGRFSLVSRP